MFSQGLASLSVCVFAFSSFVKRHLSPTENQKQFTTLVSPFTRGKVRLPPTVSGLCKHSELADPFSPPLSLFPKIWRGVAKVAFYCAYRTICMLPPSLLVISLGMGADCSSTARVQRGPSQAARCASTEDHQPPSLYRDLVRFLKYSRNSLGESTSAP